MALPNAEDRAVSAPRAPRTITEIRAGIADLAGVLERDGYAAFRDRAPAGVGAARLLERESPTDAEDARRGLTALRRLLIAADVRTRGDGRGGHMAHTMDRWQATALTRALFPIWLAEEWRQANSFEGAARRAVGQRAPAVYFSDDYGLNTWQRPYTDLPEIQVTRLEPAIPLDEVITRSRAVDSPDVRSGYLVPPTAADVRMLRVSEGAELPAATIVEGSRAVRLRKFGRLLRASYEALRRQPIDRFALYIAQLAIQTEVDQAAAAVDVMVNGDGNSGTAGTVLNLTTLDPATTANNLTLLAWFAFILSWANPYQMTAVIGRQASMLKALTLNVGTANLMAMSADVPAGLRQTLVPMNDRLANGIRYGITNDVAASTLVGFDGRFAVERLVETGSEISEAERWISKMVEEMTFSFVEGYRVEDVNAVKVLNLAA